MKSRYGFFEKVDDETLGSYPGLLDYEKIKNILLSKNDTYYTIPLVHQYRPDLISYFFYNTPHLQWVLTYANAIEDSPAGYTINRIIRIPSKDRLMLVL